MEVWMKGDEAMREGVLKLGIQTRVANCDDRSRERCFDSLAGGFRVVAQSSMTWIEKTLDMGEDNESNQDMRLVTCKLSRLV